MTIYDVDLQRTPANHALLTPVSLVRAGRPLPRPAGAGYKVPKQIRRDAIAIGKALFYRQLEQPIAAPYDDAGRAMACTTRDGSALQGVPALIAKRRPRRRDPKAAA